MCLIKQSHDRIHVFLSRMCLISEVHIVAHSHHKVDLAAIGCQVAHVIVETIEIHVGECHVEGPAEISHHDEIKGRTERVGG